MHGFFRAILQRSASVWITQEAHLDDRLYSGEQFVFTSVTHTEAKTTETNDHIEIVSGHDARLLLRRRG